MWLLFLFCFLEWLGDEYFSWYTQHLLPYGTGISLYAFIEFNLRLVLSILYKNKFNLVLKRQTDMVNGTGIS